MLTVRLRPARAGRWVPAALSTLICVALLAFPLAATATAAKPKPSIAGFVASPKSLKTNSGAVKISATVAHATTCLLTSPDNVPGLPLTTSCASKSFDQDVVLQQNTGTSALTDNFVLKATGPGGTTVDTVKVKVAPGAGQAWPTSFTGSYVGSDDGGDFPNGNFTFGGVMDTNIGCDSHSCSFDWTSVAGTWSAAPPLCSTFTADDSQGIGGGGNFALDSADSPIEIVGSFDFAVWSHPCGSGLVSTSFVSHVSSSPTFTPGAAQSVWTSDSGGTYTFNWIYS